MMRALVLVCLFLAGACQQPAHAPAVSPNESEPVSAPFLTEQEIRALLGSTPVQLEPAPADGAEIFYPDGLYVTEGRGTYPRGRYEVSAGRICVMLLRNPPQCRSVFRGEEGEVRMGVSAGSTAPSTAINFEPLKEN